MPFLLPLTCARREGRGSLIQDIGDHVYNNHFEPHEATPESYVLHYIGDTVLCRLEGEAIDVPRAAEMGADLTLQYLFSIDGSDFFLARDGQIEAPRGFSYETITWLRFAEPRHLLFAVSTGWQLARWYEENRYCGRCAHRTEAVPTSRELCCPECGLVIYPKIAPGVIVGVVDPATDRIVLTKYAGRDNARYALVAGFTEIGESIEQTVAREVMEEIGLKVKNLVFYKSQPWSYSDTLLVGFYCEADGSTQITVDCTELKEAVWMSRDEMPDRLDDKVSLTGEMMRRFRSHGAAVLDG